MKSNPMCLISVKSLNPDFLNPKYDTSITKNVPIDYKSGWPDVFLTIFVKIKARWRKWIAPTDEIGQWKGIGGLSFGRWSSSRLSDRILSRPLDKFPKFSLSSRFLSKIFWKIFSTCKNEVIFIFSAFISN